MVVRANSNQDLPNRQFHAARELAFLLLRYPHLRQATFEVLKTPGGEYFRNGRSLANAPRAIEAWRFLSSTPEGMSLAQELERFYGMNTTPAQVEMMRGAPAQVLAYLCLQRKFGFFPNAAIECRIEVDSEVFPKNGDRRFDVFGADENNGMLIECKCGPAMSPNPSEQRRHFLAQLVEMEQAEARANGGLRVYYLSYYDSQACHRQLQRILGSPERVPLERIIGQDTLWQHLPN